MLNKYNDLYDPLMGRSVCVTGQLRLLELTNHLVAECPTLKVIQLNTDGIMVRTPTRNRRYAYRQEEISVCDVLSRKRGLGYTLLGTSISYNAAERLCRYYAKYRAHRSNGSRQESTDLLRLR